MFLGKGEVEPGEMVEIVVEKTKPGQLIGRKKVAKSYFEHIKHLLLWNHVPVVSWPVG